MKHLYPETLSNPRLPEFNYHLCNRCGRVIDRSTLSFFTDEIICLVCSEIELEIKERLENPGIYEKIGFVPEVKI